MRRLDGGDELSRGLVGFWPLDEGAGQSITDLSRLGNDGRGVNAPTWGAGRWGKAAVFSGPNGASTQNYNVGAKSIIGNLQVPLSISAWIYPVSSSGFQPIIAQYAAFSAGTLIKMLRTDTGTLKYYCTSNSGTFQAVGTLVPTLNVWSFVSVVVMGDLSTPTIRIRLNAATETPTLVALRSSITATITTRIGSNENSMSHSGNEGFNGRLQNIRIWSRALTRADELRLWRDPWAGTLRDPRRVWYLPAGGTPHTAEPGAATLTWAGQAVTVQAAATLAPGAAALSWAGQAPEVQAAALLSPGAAALAWAGQAADVAAGATLAPGSATLAWSGQAPAVQAGALLSPGAAALAWQGLQASFGAGVEITVGAATLAWAGQAPTVQAGAAMSPGAAALAWQGLQVSWSASITLLPPPSRSFQFGRVARAHQFPAVDTTQEFPAVSRTHQFPE